MKMRLPAAVVSLLLGVYYIICGIEYLSTLNRVWAGDWWSLIGQGRWSTSPSVMFLLAGFFLAAAAYLGWPTLAARDIKSGCQVK